MSAVLGPMVSVVLDADVLFQAAPTRLLLLAAQSGLYRARWTTRILEETRRNLTADGRTGALRAFEGNIGLIRDPLVQGSSRFEASFVRTDAKDRHVAAAAAAAGARFLATGNVKDFDEAEAEARGFEILHFDAFGERLALENLAVLARQIDRTPPERLYRFLDLLKQSMPLTFAYLEVVFAEDL